MVTTTFWISAGSFEKVFLQSAAGAMGLPTYVPTDESPLEKPDQDLVDWRVIAWEAFKKKELGDLLRRSIVSLPIKDRTVLFLRDVKNLDTEETAWILNITAGAVRARLQRARIQIYDALLTSLFGRTSETTSSCSNFCCMFRAPELLTIR
jgi:DNA-directed RNA polymerase specialized sigma24 family protein